MNWLALIASFCFVSLIISLITLRQITAEKSKADRKIEVMKDTEANLRARLTEAEAKLKQPESDFKELIQEQEEELGFGHHVKWRSHRKPTAQTYQIHFDIEPNGQRILEELTSRFKRNPFTDDERETCRRLGRAEVVDFILNRINTANDPRYDENLELAHMEQNNG